MNGMSSAAENSDKKTIVGMGQILTGAAPGVLTSVLGSCVGLSLYDPWKRVGALAHIVLPSAHGRSGPPGKFADVAVPYMLSLLDRQGASRRRLEAKICGGANMFGAKGPMQIGDENLRAVAKALAEAHLALHARHVGGHQGRRIAFDLARGAVLIEIAGKAPTEI